MYQIQPYTGAELPSKCLCLTYDDGPGKYTYDIAKFLHEQDIQATFFVVGKYAFHHQDILEKVAGLGHLIGNHTYEHPDMPYYLSVNGDVQNQILRTDAIIRKYISDKVYFRSPYGKWSAEVANELNLNFLSTVNHIGPINWDIAGVDCLFWKNGESVDNAVKQYLSDINQKDRGIVVMHDEIADMDYLKNSNNTLELTVKLIPLLKKQGYKFVRLDEIESIKRDTLQQFKFKLKATNGKFVSLSGEDNNTMNVDGNGNTILNELSVEDLGHGKVALRASNGLFLSLQVNDENVIAASGKDINTLETFDLIPFSSNQVAFRAYNGYYLSKENRHGGKLFAAAVYMRGCEQFSFIPVNARIEKKITFIERYKSIKRQILYIKSKVQQGA